MKRWIVLCCLLLSLVLLCGCVPEGGTEKEPDGQSEQPEQPEQSEQPSADPSDDQAEEQPESEEEPEGERVASYVNITPEQAKALMDGEENYVILDVREADEYAEGHIPGALLFPLGEINAERAAAVLPDKDVMLLVYCRSGRRSKQASEQLLALGYTDIREFGGIIDWPYDVEK